MPAVIGKCKGLVPVWHYDNDKKSCQIFPYGGCDGNGNKFKTKEACEKLCA